MPTTAHAQLPQRNFCAFKKINNLKMKWEVNVIPLVQLSLHGSALCHVFVPGTSIWDQTQRRSSELFCRQMNEFKLKQQHRSCTSQSKNSKEIPFLHLALCGWVSVFIDELLGQLRFHKSYSSLFLQSKECKSFEYQHDIISLFAFTAFSRAGSTK